MRRPVENNVSMIVLSRKPAGDEASGAFKSFSI